MNRRRFLAMLSMAAVPPLTASALGAPSAAIDVDGILSDRDAPLGGNPKGDVTIVAFLDYNCPFCKRTAPDLQRFVSTDGKIRLVYKDWAILADTSVYGARLALAAKYQGKYETAHAALMGIRGQKASEASMLEAVKAAGVDMTALQRDLDAHNQAIGDLLKRNMVQADALGLQGTPVYLIGPCVVAAALDYDGFGQVVAKFRARIAK